VAEDKEITGASEVDAPVSKAKADSVTSGKVKVNFGVHIPELGETYSKADLECDQEAIDHLIEIKSKAITILKR